jgi:hypothetical protein
VVGTRTGRARIIVVLTQSDQGTACPATIAGGFEERFAEVCSRPYHRGDGGVLIFDETGDLRNLIWPGPTGTDGHQARARWHHYRTRPALAT